MPPLQVFPFDESVAYTVMFPLPMTSEACNNPHNLIEWVLRLAIRPHMQIKGAGLNPFAETGKPDQTKCLGRSFAV